MDPGSSIQEFCDSRVRDSRLPSTVALSSKSIWIEDSRWKFSNPRLVSPLGPDRVHVEVRQGNDLHRTGMSAVTPKIFLNLVEKSGLVESGALKESLAVLSREAAGKPVTLDRLASHLVNAGLITQWHCDKLKAGKYKGFFLGKYKLLRLVGTGGMSSVYLAQHTIFDQRRAIKVLPKNKLAKRTYLERFYREGRAAASLNHRNIIRVYDIANDGDTHYLVMEFVEGLDIYELVKQKGPLSITSTIDYTIQALTGLSHAHENELVHRDVKPANLLVTLEGTIKILDLGLALFREEDSSLTVMHNERVLGTADYLSPEQAVDSHNVDLRADIYSTGCTMYYMLSGRPPFNDGTLAQRIARHQTVNPESIKDLRPECPDELAAIIQKMMEKNPDDRYQACEPLIAELRQLLEEHSVSGKSKPPTAPANVAESKVNKAPGQPVPSVKKPLKAPAGPSSAKPSPPLPLPATAATAVTQDEPNKSKVTPAGATVVSAPRGSAPPPAKKPANGQQGNTDRSRREQKNSPGIPAKSTPQEAVQPIANEKSSSGADAGKKPVATSDGAARPTPANNPGGISIVVPSAKAQPEVSAGDRNLKAFVAQTRRTHKQTAVIQRGSLKYQLILTGIVLGMLLLLGIVVVIAIRLSASPDNQSSDEKTAIRISQECQSIATQWPIYLPIRNQPDSSKISSIPMS